ncbi:hypothetical protein ONS95_014339 [Cadophora gregata]|uniref:uncharacterized protein n=1 Tax=Cadophora gregata TaxID=51156 RepID=UPI0026DDC788|nr:uncharacterized protein ONS95_014339 [Cadophora gregata]KAK0112596.1 hypothetical protein ONS95_014339 [Cadophora gregata]
MPRTKRPLAEVDTNTNPSKSAKITADQVPGGKLREKDAQNTTGQTRRADQESSPNSAIARGKFVVRKPNSTYSTQLVVEEEQDSDEHGPGAGEAFDYDAKDDSKLRAFLVDRHLPTAGSRKELIARLENSSIDYETLFSTELTEILNRRHVTGAANGTKEIKIQRVRINDKIDHNTGDSHATILYVQRELWEDAIVEMEQKLKALSENPYTVLTSGQLVKKLDKQNLTSTGSKEVMAKRLWNHEKKDLFKNIKLRKEKLEQNNAEMELYIGHPVPRDRDPRAQEEKHEDAKIQNEMWAARRNAVPVCDYNWKDSHWANRTERELSEICTRRGMPGYGPKAAMLKWLDTGRIDYQDMYMGGLTRICGERGVEYRESDKKADLVLRLNEADEAEGNG